MDWLHERGFAGYVAFIDDDDEWDADHLERCSAAASDADADVVLSGLRMVRAGMEYPRSPLASVQRDDFLAGNPGWQGTNTFVKLSTFLRAGGFTDGLQSTNDRDLAVRLLSLPDLRVVFTDTMTAIGHADSQPDCLSRRGGREKRAGLAQFLRMHGHLMSADIRSRFLARALQLFDVDLRSQDDHDAIR